jgi:hypothetical protein
MVEYPLILTGIIAAFLIFGAVTAYVDRIASTRPDSHPAE